MICLSKNVIISISTIHEKYFFAFEKYIKDLVLVLMEGKRFDAVYNGLKYALIRLSPELKLIDFNPAARELVLLPRRNACAKKVLEKNGEALEMLGQSFGCAVNLVFISGNKHINSVAMRERDGYILCFIHPLLTAVSGVRLNAALSKLASFYAKNILLILEEAEKSKHRFHYRMAEMSCNACYKELSHNKYYSLSSVFKALSRKLSNLDLRVQLTVVFDDIRSVWSEAVNGAVVQFVVAEMLSVFESYGTGDKAVLHIGYSSNHMHVFLRDRLARELTDSDDYFLRIFSELMKIIDVGCDIRILDNGRFYIKTYIPTERKFCRLKKKPPMMQDSDFTYYDYCLDNYLAAERLK